MVAIVGRMTFDLDGERVVVAPFSKADMDAVQAADVGIDALELFAQHIEDPADVGERGIAWVARAGRAWGAEVEALLAKMNAPLNPEQRRRMH